LLWKSAENRKIVAASVLLLSFCCCASRTDTPGTVRFTKADTLTEEWLTRDETLHHQWLQVSAHERACREHLHELFNHIVRIEAPSDEIRIELERQLQQLERIRLNSKNMVNPHVIEEHDRAHHALTADLFNLVGAKGLHLRDSSISLLAESIRELQAQVWVKRLAYDSFAEEYNRFIKLNYHLLAEDTLHHPPPRKALFKAAVKR